MGCRSSGLLAGGATYTVVSGNSKLVSIHAVSGGGAPGTINVYDNTVGSGKIVARMIVDAAAAPSVEYDMHSVLCSEGITAVVPAGIDCTIEFA